VSVFLLLAIGYYHLNFLNINFFILKDDPLLNPLQILITYDTTIIQVQEFLLKPKARIKLNEFLI
jgi:hypothetical protein